ncbi:HEPN domain-containing protein [Arthrobacter sp. fls2-241-R2A-172]|uniref:HEPN domain-containing protein n=1 Tax=Arthrobacter sp. fls2-241-R2A-172 TaxID=3040325 RepID=UPI00254BD3C7|nr:HEPN domain-containing protein [Arthrobacter sp. fls2-241-R2A-172]
MDETQQQTDDPLSAFEEIKARHARLEKIMKAAEDRSQMHAQNDEREGYFVLIQGLRELPDETDETLPIEGAHVTTSRHKDGQLLIDEGLISLHSVDNFPGQIHLHQALKDECAHYVYQVLGERRTNLYELYISNDIAADSDQALVLAHRALCLLRATGGCFFKVPFWSDSSWNQIAGKQKRVFINPIALEENKTPLLASGFISRGDFSWVVQRVWRTIELYEIPAFRLAFDSLSEAPFQSSERMSIATSWAGLESLLGIDHELNYRIAMYLAVILSDDPETRLETRKHVKKLYGLRSKAVHGSEIKETDLVQTAEQSWVLLRNVLVAIIDSEKDLPTPETLDRILLGASQTH